ncbi:hypothetical protein DOE78_18920 [Bacillus sp. Y1]|nr:hypothetical protein [Bacillus sp. Y1]AYA77353.1 hypothetical protein DOE78_18920 [Bacillus sp. Y1]
MTHYYDDWNRRVTREEILEEIKAMQDRAKSLERLIEDVKKDLQKDVCRYTQNRLNNGLTDLNIDLRKTNEKAERFIAVLARYDAGERVEGISLT